MTQAPLPCVPEVVDNGGRHLLSDLWEIMQCHASSRKPPACSSRPVCASSAFCSCFGVVVLGGCLFVLLCYCLLAFSLHFAVVCLIF